MDQIALYSWNLHNQNLKIALMITMGLVMIAMGIVSQIYHNDFVRIEYQYDNSCIGICTITLNVPSTMKAPVFVSYEFSAYFQNTYPYFSSVSYSQLSGNSDYDSNTCWPYITNAQMGQTTSVAGNSLDPNAVAIPCGAVAQSYITDNFTIGNYNISTTDITWDSEKSKYTNIDLSKQWIDMTNERFINWMLISGLSAWRKLWGRIDQDIPAGPIQVTINNSYISQQNTRKYLLLHNDRNYDDPILVVTLPCLILGAVFIIVGVVAGTILKKQRTLSHKYKLM